MIEAIDTGFFSLNMKLVEGEDWLEQRLDVVFDEMFVNIPVIPGSMAQVQYHLGDTTTILKLDRNADGNFEKTYTPKPLPAIMSMPVTRVKEMEQHYDVVDAYGATEDTLTYSLLEAPPGMTINSTNGVIAWVAQCGPNHVVVKVTGQKGACDIQEFDIEVVDNNPPELVAPNNIVIECTGEDSQSVNLGQPIASDTCCDLTVTNDALAVFPLGDTVVTWTAQDCTGNLSSATQTVALKQGEDEAHR